MKRCSLLCASIPSSFTIKQPSLYIRLHNSHVVPILNYCCAIWNTTNTADLDLLERMQRQCIRCVESRCAASSGDSVIPSCSDRMRLADVKLLRKILKDLTRFDGMFDIRPTSSRRGFVLRPRFRTKTTRMQHIFPWRINSIINGYD